MTTLTLSQDITLTLDQDGGGELLIPVGPEVSIDTALLALEVAARGLVIDDYAGAEWLEDDGLHVVCLAA